MSEPFKPVGRAARIQGPADEIDAWRMIFMVNERAMFEFVVTEPSLREAVNRTRPGYTQRVYDVLVTWLIQSESEEPPMPGTTSEDQCFGMIGVRETRRARGGPKTLPLTSVATVPAIGSTSRSAGQDFAAQPPAANGLGRAEARAQARFSIRSPAPTGRRGH